MIFSIGICLLIIGFLSMIIFGSRSLIYHTKGDVVAIVCLMLGASMILFSLCALAWRWLP